MHELELKFSVPSYAQANLAKQFDNKTVKKQRLSAYYLDTAAHDLANNGIALRVRYEDDQWVQTLKTNGDGVAKRLELNLVLPIEATPSTLDIKTLAQQLDLQGHEKLSEQLTRVMPLDELANALTVQYFTDIERISKVIKKNNSRIEVAYDLGNVGTQVTTQRTTATKATDTSATKTNAKAQANPTEYPIHEIEFELLDGSVDDLIHVAKFWCQRHKLYLSTVTKAQRGGLLLAGKTFADPVKADLGALQLNKDTSEFVFLQQVVTNCLAQMLPNASAIAEGSPDGNLVHQLRVGIRRLRTALKVFKNSAQGIDPNWLAVLKHTFSLLGEYRDREILKIKTQPMLEAQGAPYVEWSTDVAIMPIDAVRANDFQIVLLELIGFTHRDGEHDGKQPKAKKMVAKKLDKLFNQIAEASDNFANLDTEHQHEIRKDLKTLRYVSEFAAPLFIDQKGRKGKKATELNAFLQYLEPAQDVLGEYNDNVVGHAHYQEKAKQDPNALFAMGWFGGREGYSAEACAVSLKTVKNAPKFW